MNIHPTPLDLAAWQLELAKQEEAKARDKRIAAEAAIIDLIGTKDEGTQSAKTDYFKVSTVAGYNRTLTKDWELIIGKEGHDVMDAVIRMKPEINVTALKSLATTNPAVYQRIAKAIVTKPAKVSVRVETLLQEEAA